MSGLYGNAAGGFGMPKIIEIIDSNGNTIVGTVTDSEIALDATRDDVKIGKKFAGNDGIEEGTDTRTYRTTQGVVGIESGESFDIPLSEYDQYDYTKLQCIITPFNTTIEDSVVSDRVVLNDSVYPVSSSSAISIVSKDTTNKSIKLNISNETDTLYLIHYFCYREEG